MMDSNESIQITQGWDRESRLKRSHEQYARFPKSIFAGKLVCAECGAPIGQYILNTYGKTPHDVYHCRNYRPIALKERSCSRKSMTSGELYSLVYEAIQQERKFADWVLKDFQSGPDSGYHTLDRKYEQALQESFEVLRNDDKSYFESFVRKENGKLSDEEFSSIRDKYLIDHERHNAARLSLSGLLRGFRQQFSIQNTWLKQMQELSDHYPETREDVHRLIYRIYISADDQVRITWKSNLSREGVYERLLTEGYLPDGIYNPTHRSHNNALYRIPRNKKQNSP